MRLRDAFIVFLVAAVAACEKASPPFAREGSVWRYKGTVVEEADAPSFAPLSDHYAKDRHRVYYADTYRKGQEYYSVAHPRVVEIAGADAATFRYMERGYARDASRVYFEGTAHAVADAATFALLDYAFARDKATAYCHMAPIAGSDAATFTVLDSHYAKDRVRVYWCSIETDGGARPPYVQVVALDADVGSFAPVDATGEDTDAKDAHGAFKRGRRVR